MSADLDGVNANLPPVGGAPADGAGAVAPQKETGATESTAKTQSAGLGAIMPDAKPTESAAPIPASRTAIGAAREPRQQRMGGQRFTTAREVKAAEAKEVETTHNKFTSILTGALQGESSGLKEALSAFKSLMDGASQKAKEAIKEAIIAFLSDGVELGKLEKQKERWEKVTVRPETIQQNLEPINDKINFIKKLEFYPAFNDALSHIREAVSQQKKVQMSDIMTVSKVNVTDQDEIPKLQELYKGLDTKLQQLSGDIAKAQEQLSSANDRETSVKALESKQALEGQQGYIQTLKGQIETMSGIKAKG